MEKYNTKYRWVVFATVLFAYFLIVTQRTAPGLISDQLMKEFSVTASTIGLLTSIQFLASVYKFRLESCQIGLVLIYF